jgi:hypothetical protein
MMGGRVDIAGQRFGRLTVVKKLPSRNLCTFWLCRCDCGAEREVMTQSLRAGLTKSCGCFMRERSREEIIKRATTHDMSHYPEYSVWTGILRRCNNANDRSYARYGAIGIQCRFDGFEAFLAEVGPRPSEKHSIDRIDNAGHYEPGNVRWATAQQQARNKRTTFLVEINGERKSLADWCDQTGIGYNKVWHRIRRQGWQPERALGLA